MITIGSLAHAAIPSAERSVLMALYNQTNGPSWANSTNWNGAPGTECIWFGITCDSQQTHVVSVDLSSNGLVGTLPPLDGLSALQVLNVMSFCGDAFLPQPCNALTGNIPALTGLTTLQSVFVSGNAFSGPIPSLQGLVNLQLFEAEDNFLTGPIPSLSGLTSLQEFDVTDNQLTGSVPSLSGLNSLENFEAENNQLNGTIPVFGELPKLNVFDIGLNQLTGTIPDLSGLPNLGVFWAFNNRLTGPIPALNNLVNLSWFDVSFNQLSGSIPGLGGLQRLQTLEIGNNQLSGSIPSIPSALYFFLASNNELTGPVPSFNGSPNLAEFEVANNRLTGSIPSFSGLVSLLIFDVSNNQLTGSLPNFASAGRLQGFFAGNNQLTGAIPKLNANNWESFDVSNNRLSSTIPDLTGTQFGLFAVGFNELTGAVPAGNVASASLCPNLLTHSGSPEWDEATRVSPWYRDCVKNFANIDQVGLTGTWYSPPTSGQGFSLQIFPDLLGTGRGFLSADWMTYSGETPPYGQRWYSLQGSVSSASSSTTVAIGAPASAGKFNAPPSVSSEQVGVATIAFSDCNHGTLTYSFFDFSDDTGTIPLTRLLPNTNCAMQGENGVAGSSSLLPGNWFNPATSGQGLLFDISPEANMLFASWITYASSGTDASFGNQRWYTLQSGALANGSTSLNGIPIVYATGGFFDSPSQTSAIQVGTADIAFQSCTAMTLKYNFTSGENKGQSGTINLTRLGPAPVGCSL